MISQRRANDQVHLFLIFCSKSQLIFTAHSSRPIQYLRRSLEDNRMKLPTLPSEQHPYPRAPTGNGTRRGTPALFTTGGFASSVCSDSFLDSLSLLGRAVCECVACNTETAFGLQTYARA